MKKIFFLMFALLVSAGMIFAQELPDRNREFVKDPNQQTGIRSFVVDGDVTAGDLVEAIVGTGISYSNVNFQGVLTPTNTGTAGLFTGGSGAGVGINEGIVLCCGSISNIIGPNVDDGASSAQGLPGDPDLTALITPDVSNDACFLEFDFVPEGNEVFITYVFGSEEYNEYVFSFNDPFAFFVNGVNIATIPGSGGIPVTVDNVNNGNPFGTLPNSFPQFYNNNDLQDGGPFFDTEMDGFTDVFTASAAVTPNTTNTIKITISDANDQALDSFVLVKAESFTPDPPGEEVPLSPWSLLIGAILIAAAIWFRMTRMSRA